jgi:hypothetical protein
MSELNNLVTSAGPFLAWLILLTACLFIALRFMYKNFKFSNSMIDMIKKDIRSIKYNYLNTDLSVDLYRKFATIHTFRKCDFLKQILEKNDISSRKEEIKRNIKSEFESITNEEAEDISRFKSVVGDLGHIVTSNIDWEEYFDDTFKIVFDINSTIEQKIFDFKKVMSLYIIKIEKKIRECGEKNE